MPGRGRGIPFSSSTIQQLSDCICSHRTAPLSSHRSHTASQWAPPPHTKALSLVQVQKEKELNKSNLYLSSTYSTNRHGLRAPPSLMQGYDPKAKTTCVYEGRIPTNPRTIHSQSQIRWHSMEQMLPVPYFPVSKMCRQYLHLYTSILAWSWDLILFFCPINPYPNIHHRIMEYPKLEGTRMICHPNFSGSLWVRWPLCHSRSGQTLNAVTAMRTAISQRILKDQTKNSIQGRKCCSHPG